MTPVRRLLIIVTLSYVFINPALPSTIDGLINESVRCRKISLEEEEAPWMQTSLLGVLT